MKCGSSSGKSERSRRSSILKPQKSQQPLQNVALNVPNSENIPPTTSPKVRRRVSFAEKKHVKEFCDSVEQGTVWDNSYEESEVSQRHSEHSSNIENSISIQLTNQSSIHHSGVTVVSKTVVESFVRESTLTLVQSRSSLPVNDENRIVCENEMVPAERTRIPLPSNHVKSFRARRSFSLSEISTGQNATTEKPKFLSRAHSCSGIESGNVEIHRQDLPSSTAQAAETDCKDEVPMDEKIFADESLEFTMPVATINPSLESSVLRGISISPNKECIERIPNADEQLNSSAKSTMYLEFNDEHFTSVNEPVAKAKFAVFRDTSIEVNDRLSDHSRVHQPPAITSLHLQEELDSAKENIMCDPSTMEFTEAVSKFVGHSKSCPNEFDLKALNLRPERSSFHNKSVDSGGIMKSAENIEKSQALPVAKTSTMDDKSLELMDVIRNLPILEQPQTSPEDQHTSISHSQSMNFTECVQQIPKMNQPQRRSSERTTVFHNQSVDFTQAVHNIPVMGLHPKILSERTITCDEQSADSAVAVLENPNENVTQKYPSERTTVFHNESVEFTQVVQSIPTVTQNPRTSPDSPSMTTVDKESADFMEIIPNIPNINTDQYRESLPNRVSIFHNESDNPEPVHATILCNQSVDLVNVNNSVDKSNFGKCEESETEVREKVQEQLSLDLVESVTRNSTDIETISKAAVELFEKKMLNDAKKITQPTRKPVSEYVDPELRSPLRKRSKSSGGKLIDVTAALRYNLIRKSEWPQSTDIAVDGVEELPKIASRSSISRPTEPLEGETDGVYPETNHTHHQLSTEVDVRSSRNSENSRILSSAGEAIPNLQNESMETSYNHSRSPTFEHGRADRADSISNDDSISHRLHNTTLLQDESMEITSARPGIFGARESGVIANIADLSVPGQHDQSMEMPVSAVSLPDYGESKTIMFRDDCMELTFEHRDTTESKNESLEKSRSVDALHSQNISKSVSAQHDSGNQDSAFTYGSEEITGIVPFASQIEAENAGHADEHISRKETRTFVCENREVEIAGSAPWSSDPNNAQPLDGAGAFTIEEKIHRRVSQVAKELFQKRDFSPVCNETKFKQNVAECRTGTEDLEAEIRKLSERDVLKDESKFDQATFLEEQALCMEYYEADSTASQELSAPALIREIDNSRVMDDSLTAAVWKTTSAAHNVSAESDDLSVGEGRYVSSKSLEELKSRAYSVKKLQPEEIAYDMTADISLGPDRRFYDTVQLEDWQALEPPSFILQNSITGDSPASHSEIGETGTESAKGREESNSSCVDLPEITQTVDIPRIAPDANIKNIEERMERKKMRHSQTHSSGKDISDANVSIYSSSGIRGYPTKCQRRSTESTTAAEFSSDSADGPSEKLRRQESLLPIECDEGSSPNFVNMDRHRGKKSFEDSVVVVEDTTENLMHCGPEETSIIVESTVSDELHSPGDTIDEHRDSSQSVQCGDTAADTTMEADESVHKSPFEMFKENIEIIAERFETIWEINRLDEKIVAFNFFSDSIVVAVYLKDDKETSEYPIKVIGFFSAMVEEGTDAYVSLAHNLVMKKFDSASLTRSYRTYDDIPRMLEAVSEEVKLGMFFMYDLERLRTRYVMEFDENRITFMVRTSDINAGIILKITLEVKIFEEIDRDDITVSYILGQEKVRENDIKSLITNVKRDHNFLRYYINDVQDYIDLMAETGFSAPSGKC